MPSYKKVGLSNLSKKLNSKKFLFVLYLTVLLFLFNVIWDSPVLISFHVIQQFHSDALDFVYKVLLRSWLYIYVTTAYAFYNIFYKYIYYEKEGDQYYIFSKTQKVRLCYALFSQ